MIEDGTPLRVDVVETPGHVLVNVGGDIDLSTVSGLIKEAGRLVRGPTGTLTIDMSEVDFCDSAGINGLVTLRNACHDAAWGFEVVNLRDHVHRVIVELTGLGEFLGVGPARREA